MWSEPVWVPILLLTLKRKPEEARLNNVQKTSVDVLPSKNQALCEYCTHGRYGTAQQQLDTCTRMNSKKRTGELNEFMPNPRECPAQLKSVMVRPIVSADQDIRHPVIKIVITHRYGARIAQYHLFILVSWTRFHS